MPAGKLDGLQVAFLVANEGIEQVELTEPWTAVEEAGGRPVLLAPKAGEAQAMNHLDKADRFPVDQTLAEATASDFAAVVLPGGVANPDQLRLEQSALEFLTAIAQAGKPIAVICHGPWTLVEAGLVRGRTMTSWPSVKTDITNAGGHWVDEEVVVCREARSILVSSRRPDDLPAFCQAMVEVFTPGS